MAYYQKIMELSLQTTGIFSRLRSGRVNAQQAEVISDSTINKLEDVATQWSYEYNQIKQSLDKLTDTNRNLRLANSRSCKEKWQPKKQIRESTPIKRKLDYNIDEFDDELDADLSAMDCSDESLNLNISNSSCVTSTLQIKNVEKLPAISQGNHMLFFFNSWHVVRFVQVVILLQ